MRTIKIDFDIHQLVELERRSFEETPNDALRRLLRLSGTNLTPEGSENGSTHQEDGPGSLSASKKEASASTGRPPRQGELRLRDRVFNHSSGKEAMAIVLGELARADSGFLERCFRHPGNRGTKRRHIARTLEELYPDRPDLRDQHARLPGGWFVGTNISNAQKRQVVILAATCAGLNVRTDLVVPALDIEERQDG